MNSEENAFLQKNISDEELFELAKILLRLNKMIDKLNNSNITQEYRESLCNYDKNTYEIQINKALKTLKKLISQRVKDNIEIGQCYYQGP